MKQLNHKGFSMVELIIVVAIMATLIAVMAPQYLKYVKESKINTDIENADRIVTAVSVAVADKSIPLSFPAAGSTVTVAEADIPNIDGFPLSKVDSGYTWVVTLGSDGIDSVTLGGYEIWPDPDDASNGYRTCNFH